MVMNGDKYIKTKIKLYNDKIYNFIIMQFIMIMVMGQQKKMFAELVYLRYYIAVVKVAKNHYRSVLLIDVNTLWKKIRRKSFFWWWIYEPDGPNGTDKADKTDKSDESDQFDKPNKENV